MLGIYLDDVIGLRMEDEWNEFSAGFTEAGCRAGTEIRRRMNKSIESFPNFERIVLSCIDADRNEKWRIFQHFSKSTRISSSREQILQISEKKCKILQKLSEFCKILGKF